MIKPLKDSKGVILCCFTIRLKLTNGTGYWEENSFPLNFHPSEKSWPYLDTMDEEDYIFQ